MLESERPLNSSLFPPRRRGSADMPDLLMPAVISLYCHLIFFTLIGAEHINMSSLPDRIPVLLLKTKSTPVDSYEEYFSNEPFTPTFVPVLEHRPNLQNLDLVRSLLLGGKFGRDDNVKYGGMIFTSQRAVEGFAKVVDEVEADRSRTRNELELTSSWLTS
jgi:hypothetical protein